MQRLVLWMKKNKALTFLLAGFYFVAGVLIHERVSKVFVWVQDRLTLELYNDLITLVGIIVAFLVTAYLLRSRREGALSLVKAFLWSFTLAAAVISYNILTVTNIETIHFPQYALLAVPLFALTGRYGETVLTVTVLGIFDEAYQYFIFRNWKYFDFNDIILNMIGAGIGVLIVTSVVKRSEEIQPLRLTDFAKSPAVIASLILLCAVVILLVSGLLSMYPRPDTADSIIFLSQIPPPDQFWTETQGGKTYHILSPAEGLSLMLVFLGFYYYPDCRVEI